MKIKSKIIMEFKGTKGEWVNGYGEGLTGPTTPTIRNPTVDEERKYIPISINKETIAIIIQPENNSINQMEANAKLIASAPEMFEMLKLILNERVSNHYFKIQQLLTKITE